MPENYKENPEVFMQDFIDFCNQRHRKEQNEMIEKCAPNDAVHHPEHYTKGAVECIDAIRASMTVAAYRGYLKGNVLKYIWRYEEKDGVESLEKAQVYLGWLIENIKRGGV